MPIAEGIAAARLAMDAGSKALDLLRHPKIDDNAVRTKITEMQDLVFSAQRALGEAEEENRSLKRRIEDLQRVVWRQLLFPVNDNYFSRRRQLQTC
jgi:hypothetical protein